MSRIELAGIVAVLALGAWGAIGAARAAPASAPVKAIDVSPAAAVAPDCARGGRRVQREPAVAFGKGAGGKGVYLVAWSDGTRQPDAPTADIYCARVDAETGRPLDPAGVRVCDAPGLQECPAVAFDGTNFL